MSILEYSAPGKRIWKQNEKGVNISKKNPMFLTNVVISCRWHGQHVCDIWRYTDVFWL